MPDQQQTRPLTTGDLIGQSVRAYRANMRDWLPLLILPTIIVLLGRILYQAAVGWFPREATAGLIGSSACLVAGLIILLAGKWLLLMRQLAFVRLVTGFSSSYEDARLYLKKRRWSILSGICFLFFIIVAVSALWTLEIVAASVLMKVLPAPGVIAILLGIGGMVLSLAFIMFAFVITLALLACEEGAVTTLLSRGFSMSSQSFWRTISAGILIGVTVNLIATPLWIPLTILGTIDGIRLGSALTSASGLPIYWQIAISVWETTIEMITQPVLYIAYGFYYYDLRLRFEGLDILNMLQALKLKQEKQIDFYE